MIEIIDSKLIFVCLINDHSLIADLHIYDYGSAECAIISLECTKVKRLIFDNYIPDQWEIFCKALGFLELMEILY